MRRQLLPALVVFLALTVLTGIAYPLAVTGHRAGRVPVAARTGRSSSVTAASSARA